LLVSQEEHNRAGQVRTEQEALHCDKPAQQALAPDDNSEAIQERPSTTDEITPGELTYYNRYIHNINLIYLVYTNKYI